MRAAGAGYLEAGFEDRDYPRITLGFRAGYAVVSLFTGAEQMFLLGGNGVVAPHEQVEVPILDELAAFTGDFVMDVDCAWNLVRAFIRSGSAGHLGTWHEL